MLRNRIGSQGPPCAMMSPNRGDSMRLVQTCENGETTAAIQEEGGYRLMPGSTVTSLLVAADGEGTSVKSVAERRLSELRRNGQGLELVSRSDLLMPLLPKEVWGCGCTYAPSADFRDGELGTRDGMYSYVHNPENRPETFFKGTARVCVGPNAAIGIRRDSTFTAPEPELGIVTGSRLQLMGYTLGNDVSAWDIERENPLYLPQSKVYKACCSLGPVFVTPDEISDPYALQMTCTIRRGGETIFEGSASTSLLQRTFEELIDYVGRSNIVPTPTVILTGTGIIVEQDHALQPGDVCSIHVPEIGTLANPAALV